MAWGEKRFESYKKIQEDRTDQLAAAIFLAWAAKWESDTIPRR